MGHATKGFKILFHAPSHLGIILCEKIYTLLSEWNIVKKLFSMTLQVE